MDSQNEDRASALVTAQDSAAHRDRAPPARPEPPVKSFSSHEPRISQPYIFEVITRISGVYGVLVSSEIVPGRATVTIITA